MHPYSALVMLLTACSPETRAVASAQGRATPPKASQVTFLDYLQAETNGQATNPTDFLLNSPKPEVCPYQAATDLVPAWDGDTPTPRLAAQGRKSPR